MSSIVKSDAINERFDTLFHNDDYDCSVQMESNKCPYFILCSLCFWCCTSLCTSSEEGKIQECHNCKNNKLSSTPISSRRP
jgi:hypothetical protein